jgi:hypothetical protein
MSLGPTLNGLRASTHKLEDISTRLATLFTTAEYGNEQTSAFSQLDAGGETASTNKTIRSQATPHVPEEDLATMMVDLILTQREVEVNVTALKITTAAEQTLFKLR